LMAWSYCTEHCDSNTMSKRSDGILQLFLSIAQSASV